MKGRNFHDFTKILLEKVGGTYLSLIFLRASYIPTVQKNRTLNGSGGERARCILDRSKILGWQGSRLPKMTDDEEELGTDQVPADAMRSTAGKCSLGDFHRSL